MVPQGIKGIEPELGKGDVSGKSQETQAKLSTSVRTGRGSGRPKWPENCPNGGERSNRFDSELQRSRRSRPPAARFPVKLTGGPVFVPTFHPGDLSRSSKCDSILGRRRDGTVRPT